MGDLIPMVAVVAVFSIPIVAILTSHQRKMAELVRSQPQQDVRSRQQLDMMQAQINDLRNQLHEHIVRTDGPPLSAAPQAPPPVSDIEQRLNG
ncbi:MAG: hypothetical protein JST30_08445 [Armatimonadetes bacterium]|nr:hypothetical protein [Armatimonadota bacterium]